jgi:signal transduction histidine kinase
MAVLSALLAMLFWRKGSKQFKLHFVLISLLVFILSVSYMLELFTDSLAVKLLWNDIEYISVAGVPVVYFLIVVKYAGREDLLTSRNILLIMIIPVFDLLMLWMNGSYHLFYQSVALGPDPFQTYSSVKGPVYFLHLVYSLGLAAAAIGIVSVAFIRSPKVQRVQIGLVILSAVIPAGFITIASLGESLSVSMVDGMIISFILSSLVLYLAVFRYGLFYATPLVLNSIADLMQDGTIMLNRDGQITYLNAVASHLSQRDAGFPLGKQIEEIFPSIQAAIGDMVEGLRTIEIVSPEGQPLRLEARVSTIRSGKKELGRLVILRDLTSLRRSEEALATLNSKLNVLYGVTRHDILNRTSVINGYGQLLREDRNSDRSDEYLKKLLESSVAIEHIINFTKDYEKVGSSSPEWQNISKVYQMAKVLCAEQGIEYVVDTGSIEVYADPMLERLFYILLDNSYKHGMKVTRISLTVIKNAEECLIVYQDDGVGIKEGDKGMIFHKGFGKDSGLGLYLGTQILAITGIGIRENGPPSKGAKFELMVPKGMWRKSESKGASKFASENEFAGSVP